MQYDIIAITHVLLPCQLCKRRILLLRYISGMEWDEIAKRIHYSERHAKRMLDDAIDHLIIPMELAEGEKESAKEQTCHGMS